jgi:mercuric ion transport protein
MGKLADLQACLAGFWSDSCRIKAPLTLELLQSLYYATIGLGGIVMATSNPLESTLKQEAVGRKTTEPGKTLVSLGSVVAALAASSCCVLPLVFFFLGISGAWISNLTALAPYQPYFVVLTLGFLVAGFVMVYRKPKAVCAPGSYCATPTSDRIAKASLWTATVIIAIALAFPYVAPLFIET